MPSVKIVSVVRKPMPIRGGLDRDYVESLKAEEDENVLFYFDTFHDIPNWTKDISGKHGLCKKCHLIIDMTSKEMCLLEQIRNIHDS